MPIKSPKATRKSTRATQSKVCACCLKRRNLDAFGDNPRMALGKKSYCRPCSARLQREWNAAERTQKKAAKSKKSRSKTARREAA